MLFSLTNLKRRSVRDPDGELAVVPKLLHGRTAVKLVEQAIEVFDSYVGRTRAEYDPRALEAVMSDYRLARCIEACLLTYYSFVQPGFSDLLSPGEIAALAGRGFASPTDLRLAVWDAANEQYGGFVLPGDRPAFLAALASGWDLPENPALLESLLALDSEAVAVLTPKRERPSPREVVRQYNRGAVQTLLAHSTRVELSVSKLPGFALKRLYFVAKRRGVLVEIDAAPGGYKLTLFGPEQAFGTAEKYGQQLADVALSLLRQLLGMEDEARVAVTAYLVLHDRPYRFHLTEEIMSRLEFAPEKVRVAPRRRIAEAGVTYSVGTSVENAQADDADAPEFDSLLEAALYREHKALEKQGYTHGWGIEREPDPLLAPGIVLIPDFAFNRGDTRVYMEIAGFWSPSYRERKLSKLRSLAAQPGDEAALVIAAPLDAVEAFGTLPYPVVPYKNKVKATDILSVLDERYGSREQRQEAALGQLESLREEARVRGFVAESEIARALEAYTRTELLERSGSLATNGLLYVAGVGLLSESALQRVHDALSGALVEGQGRIDLEKASSIVAKTLAPSVDVESLVRLWPEWRVERPSLFEAFLVGEGG